MFQWATIEFNPEVDGYLQYLWSDELRDRSIYCFGPLEFLEKILEPIALASSHSSHETDIWLSVQWQAY